MRLFLSLLFLFSPPLLSPLPCLPALSPPPLVFPPLSAPPPPTSQHPQRLHRPSSILQAGTGIADQPKIQSAENRPKPLHCQSPGYYPLPTPTHRRLARGILSLNRIKKALGVSVVGHLCLHPPTVQVIVRPTGSRGRWSTF